MKGCVEEAVGGYGGVGFVADKVLFYAQVGDPEEGRASAARVNATGSSRATNILRSRSNNNVNATLRLPHPTAAMPVCQISHPRKLHLQPISLLDCYHLFYNLLASPAVERTIVLKGLSPIRYETYGTCTVQLRGNSAVAADTFKFVEVLLAAVRIVQTCVLSGGAELGGAVGVGPRGRYVVRVFNLVGEGSGDGVKSG